MLQLNLPSYSFKRKNVDGKEYIFDVFRKKYIQLTPEEWVRQNTLRYLIEEKAYPENLIAVEKKLVIAGRQLRFDALVFDNRGNAKVLIEFKAPHILLSQEVFDQASVYNYQLKVPYLLISNGLQHYFCKVDFDQNQYIFAENIPKYNSINII